ncbi:hypothetical protein [Streptomyces sp. CC0208]|uniref:hypothetical protein n=1 Tax=Streptomyces sp. CC0208 TaxID=2306165 RepID=UPI001F08EE53|nr:hypothetical protein [Streptomyces sp. CC0208]
MGAALARERTLLEAVAASLPGPALAVEVDVTDPDAPAWLRLTQPVRGRPRLRCEN